jgi:hypothetical protein
MNFREKVKYLLFIIFVCLFLIPILLISKKENFENASYGKWELVLRQTLGEGDKNQFVSKTTNLNLDALYDKNGKITKDNFYNGELIEQCKWDGQYLLKLNYYDDKTNTEPGKVIVWKQNSFESSDLIPTLIEPVDESNFTGIVSSTLDEEQFIYKGNKSVTENDSYVLGMLSDYVNSNEDVSFIPGYVSEKEDKTLEVKSIEKVELMVWNPRPRDVNTYNKDFTQVKISKVDMNETNHKDFYNKVLDISGEFDEETNRYSYCFGKLRCSDISSDPVLINGEETYKPYCNKDNSNNPVFCEGSILYNVKSNLPNTVNINDCSNNNNYLSLDMMGKYADDINLDTGNSHYYNLFRGLTTPYSSDYKDPEINGNYVTMYDSSNSSIKIKTHLCNFFSNTNLDNDTNIQSQCFEELPEDDSCISDISDNVITTNKNCIANYGTNKIETKYHDYVCNEGETCVGYECGVSFGNCQPSTI